MKLFIFLILYTLGFSEIIIKDENRVKDFKLTYFNDIEANKSIEDIEKINFNENLNSRFSLGYIQGNTWFKLDITNHTKNKNFVLYFTTQYFSRFTIFEKINDSWQKNRQGCDTKRENPSIGDKNPIFRFTLDENETKTIYIKSTTKVSATGEFIIYSNDDEILIDKGWKLILYSFYFGTIFFAIILSLFLFLTLKENLYLYYLVYLVSFCLFIISLENFHVDLGFWETRKFLDISPALAMIFFIHFFRKLINLKEYYPKTNKLLNFISFLFVILICLIFYSFDPWYEILNLFVIPTLLIILLTVFLRSLQDGILMKIYFFILLTHIASLGLLAAVFLGYVENNLFNLNAFKVFSFLEAIFFTLLLANRIQEENIEKLKIKDKLLRKEKSYQKILEDEVHQRTLELYEKNKELEKTSITDNLTQVLNRLGIDKKLEEEFERYKRSEKEFGVILMDIDYFKKVNDTYGHQVGDILLKEISQILKSLTRNTDQVGRWGGEEFFIICTNINFDGLNRIAEKLRSSIEEFNFTIVGNKTASFGATIIRKDDTKESLLKRVDNYLYKAKDEGRNKIINLE